MIDVIPARPWMAEQLKLQTVQMLTGQAMTADAIAIACEGGMALAAVEDGRIIGMSGLFERHEGAGVAWALLSEGFASRRFTAFKLMKRALDLSPLDRVEAYVVEGHDAGERMLTHLGFSKEGVMRKFWQGRNFSLFSRVR